MEPSGRTSPSTGQLAHPNNVKSESAPHKYEQVEVHSGVDVTLHSRTGPAAEPVDVAFIFQSSCYLHRYTRSKDDSHIVEKADRLRSVFLGVAVAHAVLTHLRQEGPTDGVSIDDVLHKTSSHQDTALEDLLDNLKLASTSAIARGWPFSIVPSQRRIPLDASFVTLAHGQKYIQSLATYIKGVSAKQAQNISEVPDSMSQGDLYLCPDSLQAMEGALGACCDAVDDLYRTKSPEIRRFVCIRPPGHHCESDNPMGFCWVNNVAVAAAYAHQMYGVNRVVIFDIDLHHGNGTQEIVWRINSAAHKVEQSMQKHQSPRKGSPKKTLPPSEQVPAPLRIFYGSLHDVNSYPCEELDPVLTANASVNISGGAGGQHVCNVHLEAYEDEEDFQLRLYPAYKARLFDAAERFLEYTSAATQKTLVLISAGFDASEHEYASMSRHGAKVPTSFFPRFARDSIDFAKRSASGRLLSVLEGGYSPRALSSGAGSFITGLVDIPAAEQKERLSWWNIDNVLEYERHLQSSTGKGRKGPLGQSKLVGQPPPWKTNASDVLSKLQETLPAVPNASRAKEKSITPPSSSIRTTRSQTGSPASKQRPEILETKRVPSALAVANPVAHDVGPPPPVTPHASPFTIRTVASSATPLVRFTFKAGDTRSSALPMHTQQTFREATNDSDSSDNEAEASSASTLHSDADRPAGLPP